MASGDPRGREAEAGRVWRVMSCHKATGETVCPCPDRRVPDWVMTIRRALRTSGNPDHGTRQYCRAWVAGLLRDRMGTRKRRLQPGRSWEAGWYGTPEFYWIEEVNA